MVYCCMPETLKKSMPRPFKNVKNILILNIILTETATS